MTLLEELTLAAQQGDLLAPDECTPKMLRDSLKLASESWAREILRKAVTDGQATWRWVRVPGGGRTKAYRLAPPTPVRRRGKTPP